MRSARTSMMRAFVCDSSVTIPACEPVSEIARWPRSWIAIAHSAHEMRSPVESSMSISRGSGYVGDLLGHRDQLVGRLAARRQHGDDAVAELALVDDPPRGALDPLGVGDRGAAELHHDQLGHPPQDIAHGTPCAGEQSVSRVASATTLRVRTRRAWRCAARSHLAPAGERLAERDLVGVLEVRADRQTAGQARDGELRARGCAAARRCAARSPRRWSSGWSRARPRAPSGVSPLCRRSTRASSSAIFRSSGSMPSIGESAPPSTW